MRDEMENAKNFKHFFFVFAPKTDEQCFRQRSLRSDFFLFVVLAS